jgi:hypothetical protein
VTPATRVPIRRCGGGPRYASPYAAARSKRARHPGFAAVTGCGTCGGWHVILLRGPARPARKTAAAVTGFPARVRLAIRMRAGNGRAEDACCEACGAWLGRYGGQVQHIRARQMGGSRRRNSTSNGALLCGTPLTGCHGACERRDPRMRAAGFWLLQSDPPQPVMLHGLDGGILAWLDDSGSYQPAAGLRAAA